VFLLSDRGSPEVIPGIRGKQSVGFFDKKALLRRRASIRMAGKGALVNKQLIARKGFYSKEEKEKWKRHPNCFFHVHC
jgi:hypothetical protein